MHGITLITKGYIDQGGVTLNRIHKFILPLSLGINKKSLKLDITPIQNRINIINPDLKLSLQSQELKTHITNSKSLRLNIKKICG